MSRKGFEPLFTSGNSYRQTSVWAYNGHKFRINVEHTNGDPLGFNYKKCLDIMTPDGTWQHVADNRDAGIPYCNLYYCDPGDPDLTKDIQNTVDAFMDYIEAVYS